MKRQGGGSIVMINSMIVRDVLPTMASYAASKGALLAASQGMAIEVTAEGPDEDQAMDALEALVGGGFGEEA